MNQEEQGAGGRGQGRMSQVRPKTTDDTFENLQVWQDAIELGVCVYAAFRECRDFGFRQQIQDAVASVSNNIAEGYERDSNQEFVRFLIIAKGSCGEVRSQCHLARRVGLLSPDEASLLVERAKQLSKRLSKFIQVRRERFG